MTIDSLLHSTQLRLGLFEFCIKDKYELDVLFLLPINMCLAFLPWKFVIDIACAHTNLNSFLTYSIAVVASNWRYHSRMLRAAQCFGSLGSPTLRSISIISGVLAFYLHASGDHVVSIMGSLYAYYGTSVITGSIVLLVTNTRNPGFLGSAVKMARVLAFILWIFVVTNLTKDSDARLLLLFIGAVRIGLVLAKSPSPVSIHNRVKRRIQSRHILRAHNNFGICIHWMGIANIRLRKADTNKLSRLSEYTFLFDSRRSLDAQIEAALVDKVNHIRNSIQRFITSIELVKTSNELFLVIENMKNVESSLGEAHINCGTLINIVTHQNICDAIDANIEQFNNLHYIQHTYKQWNQCRETIHELNSYLSSQPDLVRDSLLHRSNNLMWTTQHSKVICQILSAIVSEYEIEDTVKHLQAAKSSALMAIYT